MLLRLFPSLDEHRVARLARRAKEDLDLLAVHLESSDGARWDSYDQPAGAELCGRVDVDAQAGSAWLTSFEVDLSRDFGSEAYRAAQPLPWEIRARISVRCDSATSDCGMHVVEEWERDCATSDDAARSLLEATGWLLRRGTGEPLASWLERDPMRHRPARS